MQASAAVPQLSPEQIEIIDRWLEVADQKVTETSQASAAQAFNLGCTIGLIPATLIVFITYIATRTWVAAILSGILMVLALIGLANLVALIARSRTIERQYKLEIAPDLERVLEDNQISNQAFANYVQENMSSSANLWPYLPKSTASDNQKKKFRLSNLVKK